MKKKLSAVRLDSKNSVDDVVVECNMFRLERMAEDAWWAAAIRGDKEISFWIYKKGKEVVVTIQEDSIGCEDDTSKG